ncbi:MAG: VTT domain-containing protein [Chloroflexi bacterium]|nr:VTT domain-containing protein [Anaerolineaceae bacterium]NMB89294.1 VTT domain-containing protein [Chloroflexota bacterium]
MRPEQRTLILRVLALVFVIAVTVSLFLLRDRLQHLEFFGYPGIFLLSILANATVILPLPGVLITSAMGAVFDPFWVAVAAGSGAALGELSGYLAGFSGQGVVQRVKWHAQLEDWMRRYGDITILVLSFVPNPAFDVAGITAGALKLPLYRFLFWCWLGKVIKMLVFAYGGSTILNFVFPRG